MTENLEWEELTLEDAIARIRRLEQALAIKRKQHGPGGPCVCKLSEDGDILSLCNAHKDYLEAAIAEQPDNIFKAALEEIEQQDPVEIALDPEWPQRIARNALSYRDHHRTARV